MRIIKLKRILYIHGSVHVLIINFLSPQNPKTRHCMHKLFKLATILNNFNWCILHNLISSWYNIIITMANPLNVTSGEHHAGTVAVQKNLSQMWQPLEL